jgi:hypothetical protein
MILDDKSGNNFLMIVICGRCVLIVMLFRTCMCMGMSDWGMVRNLLEGINWRLCMVQKISPHATLSPAHVRRNDMSGRRMNNINQGDPQILRRQRPDSLTAESAEIKITEVYFLCVLCEKTQCRLRLRNHYFISQNKVMLMIC